MRDSREAIDRAHEYFISRSDDSARQLASCVQTVVVNRDDGMVIEVPLHLPIALALDEIPTLPPNISPDDLFSISSAELQEIGEKLEDTYQQTVNSS